MRVGLLACVVAAALAGAWMRTDRDSPAPPAAAASEAAAPPRVRRPDEPVDGPEEPRVAARPPRDTPVETVPKGLPPKDVPVVALIRELDARARNGDAQAACRLSSELLRCRDARHWNEREAQTSIDILAHAELPAAALEIASDRLAQDVAYNDRVVANCAGVTADDLRKIPRYALMAAEAGHVGSMVTFADAVGVGGEDIVADPELYALYRERGFAVFQAAFEAGHPQAAQAWARSLDSRGFSFLAGVLPAEWRTPGVARALADRLARERYPDLPPPRDAARPWTDAERKRADELFRAHFAASPWLRPARLPTRRTPRLELNTAMCAP